MPRSDTHESCQPSILSGSQEFSNTYIAQEAVAQIIGTSSYSANIKGLQVMDEMIGETLDIKS